MIRVRLYDTNLSWCFNICVCRWILTVHWWYDRSMRAQGAPRWWWPVQAYFCYWRKRG